MLMSCGFLSTTLYYYDPYSKLHFYYSAAKDEHLNISWAFERIRYFGRLSDYNEEDSHEMQEFQEILDNIDTVDGIYDMQTKIQQVGVLESVDSRE